MQALYHKLGPLLSRSLASLKEIVPTSVLKLLKEERVRQKLRSGFFLKEAETLMAAARAEGLNPVVFKGHSLEYYYGEVGLRHIGDLDMLVTRAEIYEMAAVAQRFGYVFSRGSANGPVVYNVSMAEVKDAMDPAKNCVHVKAMFNPDDRSKPLLDIHPNVLEPSMGDSFDVEGALKRAQEIEFGGHLIRVLEPADALWAYVLNFYRDVDCIVNILLRRDLRFSRYCDIRELLAHSPDDVCKKLIDRIATPRAKLACAHALYTTEDFFPGTVPHDVLEHLKSERWAAQHEVNIGAAFFRGSHEPVPLGFWSRDVQNRIFDPARMFEVLPLWWGLNERTIEAGFHAFRNAKHKINQMLELLYGSNYQLGTVTN